jgi:hypothetical protein
MSLAAPGLLAIGFPPSRGTGDVASFVAQRGEQGRQRLRESYSLGFSRGRVFSELDQVAAECGTPNWDGYGAEPVSAYAYRHAFTLLRALPPGTPEPAVGADPDGDITLEWHHSARRTLSISVNGDGDLIYAALLGASRAYGVEPFWGVVPQIVLNLVERVTSV